MAYDKIINELSSVKSLSYETGSWSGGTWYDCDTACDVDDSEYEKFAIIKVQVGGNHSVQVRPKGGGAEHSIPANSTEHLIVKIGTDNKLQWYSSNNWSSGMYISVHQTGLIIAPPVLESVSEMSN